MTDTMSRSKTGHRRLVLLGALAVLVVAVAVAAPVYLAGGGTRPSPLRTISGLANMTVVAFSPDGSLLAASDAEGDTYLWRVASGQRLGPLHEPGSQGIAALAYSPDGSLLATGDLDGRVYLWQVSTHRLLATLTLSGGGSVHAIAFSPDGSTLAVGGAGKCFLWDVATRRLVATIRPPDNPHYHLVVKSVAFSGSGQTLATGTIGTTYLWNVADRRLVGTLHPPEGTVGEDYVTSVVFTPGGKTIATTDNFGPGDALLWGVRTQRLIATLRDPDGLVQAQASALRPGGQILAVGGWQGAGRNYIRLWDVTTRRLVKSLVISQYGGNATAMAFSPDEKTLAYVDDNGQVLLWTVGALP